MTTERGLIMPIDKLRTSTTHRVIYDEVEYQLRDIQSEIKLALEDPSKNSIRYALPTSFQHINMLPSKARTYIYYYVMNELTEAGYTVGLGRGKNSHMLTISWVSEEQKSMEKYMENYINEHTK